MLNQFVDSGYLGTTLLLIGIGLILYGERRVRQKEIAENSEKLYNEADVIKRNFRDLEGQVAGYREELIREKELLEKYCDDLSEFGRAIDQKAPLQITERDIQEAKDYMLNHLRIIFETAKSDLKEAVEVEGARQSNMIDSHISTALFRSIEDRKVEFIEWCEKYMDEASNEKPK